MTCVYVLGTAECAGGYLIVLRIDKLALNLENNLKLFHKSHSVPLAEYRDLQKCHNRKTC